MPEYVDVNDVCYQRSRRGVGETFTVREGDLTVKLMRYKAGDEVPFHRHTDEKQEKLIVRGKGVFTDLNGRSVTLGPGLLYMCGSGASYYSGRFLEDTIMMIIESSDSQIELPPA